MLKLQSVFSQLKDTFQYYGELKKSNINIPQCYENMCNDLAP